MSLLATEPSNTKTECSKAHAVLLIMVGSERKSYSLAERRYTIGRSKQCSICIDSAKASRVQATLLRDQEGNYHLFDGDKEQRSTNGTYVNGSKVVYHLLQPGDVIHFGSRYATAHFQSSEEQIAGSEASVQADKKSEI
jgi:pSer/pThr/pTyr-binding forkhead associated (FHA) protein